MLLDCVVTGCNMNPLYYDFIPMFIESWKTLYPSIDIKIILINDVIPEDIKQYEQYIICFKPLENIETSFQAQVIRLLYPCILNQYENGILITDIDMIPMNNNYYSKPIEHIENDKFVCYRDVLIQTEKQIAMCYNIALSSTWSKVFNIHSIDDIIKKLQELSHQSSWFTDQIYLYKKVMDFKNTNSVVILNDNITKFKRLNRSEFIYNDKKLNTMILSQQFSDYHVLRPYNKYKEQNDIMLSKLKEIKI
jgi:hypothetical protein